MPNLPTKGHPSTLKRFAMQPTEIVPGVTPRGYTYFYEIYPDTGLCRKVFSLSRQFNDGSSSLEGIDEEGARQNTLMLYRFLRERIGDEAVRKGTHKEPWVEAYGYKMYYGKYAFIILDSRNYYKEVELPDGFFNVTPKQVLNYITRYKDVRPAAPEEPKIEATDLRLDKKKKSNSLDFTKLKNMNANIQVEDALLEGSESKAYLLELLSAFHDKELTVAEVKEKFYARINSHKIKTRIGKILNKLNRRTYDKAIGQVVEAYEGLELRPKPPRFEFYNLPTDDDRIFGVQDNGDGSYEVKYRSVEGTRLSKRFTRPNWMWRQALHYRPQAMQLMMKVAKGEITEWSEYYGSYNLSDRFEAFDEKLLDKSEHSAALLELAEDILSDYAPEFWTCQLDWEFLNRHVPKGTKVRFVWSESFCSVEAELISCNPCQVRLEDGTVHTLLKHMRYKIFEAND